MRRSLRFAFLVVFLCFPGKLAQQHPSPQRIDEIYSNVPPVVKATLHNAGFAKNFRGIENNNIHLPNLKETQNHAASNHHTIRLPSHHMRPQVQVPLFQKFNARQPYESIRRGEPPFVVIRPLTIPKQKPSSQKSKARIVLALPNDNIQILSADVSDSSRGNNAVPATVSLREPGDSDRFANKAKNYETHSYGGGSSRFLPPPAHSEQHSHSNNRNLNFGHGYRSFPFGEDGLREQASEEDHFVSQETYHGRRPYYPEYDDMASAGGHVTLLKAQKAGMPKLLKAQRANGRTVSAMKAILIEPKQLKAKRVTVVKSDARKVMPIKATLVKATHVSASKTKGMPVQVKAASYAKAKTHRHDRPHLLGGASNVHVIRVEPHPETEEPSRLLGDPGIALPSNVIPMDQDDEMPPVDLQCGGNNDLGWCDLGPHYPISEVDQIIHICEDLVSRMYVDTPSTSEVMEDLQAYSMAHNITERFNRRWDSNSWKWEGKSSVPLQGTLCDIKRSTINPSFAQDVNGKWHVIIQTEKFPQRVALEVCRKPGQPCNQKEVCNQNSQCVQKYSYQHLISFDPESAETCPFNRVYKFPTSCVCRIPRNSPSQ